MGRKGNSGHRKGSSRQRRRRNKKGLRLNKLDGPEVVSRSQRRNRKRRALESRLKMDSSPGNKQKGQFTNLATSISTCWENTEMLNKILQYLQDGKLTSFIILSPGDWLPEVALHLKQMLEDKGVGWAWQHVVFPLATETDRRFIGRVFESFEITHYVESNKELIMHALHNKDCDLTRLFYMNPDTEGTNSWDAVNKWLIKTVPVYWRLRDQGKDSFNIIPTKKAQPEQISQQTENELQELYDEMHSKVD